MAAQRLGPTCAKGTPLPLACEQQKTKNIRKDLTRLQANCVGTQLAPEPGLLIFTGEFGPPAMVLRRDVAFRAKLSPGGKSAGFGNR
jgi:hypothetical protein